MISLTSPVRTRAHGWPAGAKLAALSAATLALFWVNNLAILGGALAVVVMLYLSGGAGFARAGLRALRMLWPFVLVVALWHGLTGTVGQGAGIILRFVTLVALANLVTMTTPLSAMIDVLAWLLAPLRRVGLPTRALEISVALVVRMTPVLLQKGQALGDAWRARSPRRPGWRIVLPFTLVALDDADHIADALAARGGVTDERTG